MKKLLLILVAAVVSINIAAQPKFEKLYTGSDDIVSLGGNFFAVKNNGKWGVMKNKTKVLDFYYDSIDVLSDGIITFVKNSQAGFADTLGNVISIANYPLETPYERADESPLNVFQSGSALVYNGSKLILLGKDGNQLNDDSAEIISKTDNTVIFKKNAAYGIMDAMGNVLAENKYRRLHTVIAGELYAYTSTRDGMDYLGLISKDGQILSSADYDDMTIINKNDKYYIKAFVSTGKQALYDAQGNLLFRPLYQNVEPVNNSRYFAITDNTRKGIIGLDYITYVPAQYDDVSVAVVSGDTLFIARNDNMTYILDKNNKTVDAFDGNIKDFISYDNKELVYIADSMLNYGIRSSQKGWVIDPQYIDVFAQVKDILAVRKNSKWGAVDFDNNIVIPFEYKKVRASKAKTCIVFYDGKKNSVVLKDDGSQITFEKVEEVLPMDKYIEYKSKKEKVRLYLSGNELKNQFKVIGTDKDGIVCAQDKKGWSYFDSKTFEPLTDMHFDYVTSFTKNRAFVVNDKQLQIIDRNFNVIQTLLDATYLNNMATASVLSLSDVTKIDNLVVKDKNGKCTLIKINR